MKKGFTLIELLSVLVILAIISIIIVPIISDLISESKQRAYNTQVENIKEAANKWSVSNDNLLPSDGSTYKLPLATLISEKYITNVKNGKLKNPKDGSTSMEGCVYIYYSNEYNQYVFDYKEEC